MCAGQLMQSEIVGRSVLSNCERNSPVIPAMCSQTTKSSGKRHCPGNADNSSGSNCGNK